MNVRILSSTLLGLLLSALLAACGGGSGGTGSGSGNNDTNNIDTGSIVISTNGIGTIGANGGTITTPEGVSVMVPAGTLSEPATVRIAKDGTNTPESPPNLTPLSPIYEVTPHIPQLNGFGLITIPFDASRLAAGETPHLFVAEPGGGWVELRDAVINGNSMTAGLTHFSYFSIAASYPCTSDDHYVCGKDMIRTSFELTGVPAPQAIPVPPGSMAKYKVTEPSKFLLKVNIDPQSYTGVGRDWYCHKDAKITVWRRYLGGNGVNIRYWPVASATGRTSVSIPFEIAAVDNGSNEFTYSLFCAENDDDPTTHSFCLSEFFPLGECNSRLVGWTMLRVDIQPSPDTPVISRHPQGLTVVAGQAASFTAAGGADASQTIGWERSNNSGTNWSEVQAAANAQSSTYTLNSTVIADDGAWFRAVFCNSAGTKQTCVRSANAELSVVPKTAAPAFSRQPANFSVLAGQTASITVAAVGTHPPEIRFYRVGGTGVADSEVKMCPASGVGTVTACSYTTGALTESQSGMEFYARATNSAGSVDSSHAIVTVTRDGVAPVIVTQSSDISATVGGNASFSVGANGTASLSYQWRFNGAPLVDRAEAAGISGIHGSNSAMLTLGNVQQADVGVYTVVVSNVAGSATTAGANLTVNQTEATSWTRQYGSTGTDRGAYVAAGLQGTVYLVGMVDGVANGNYLVKYSATGEQLWSKTWGYLNDSANGVATDASGNVYVVGSTIGNLGGKVNSGVYDVFVVKYDESGKLLWTELLGSAVKDEGKGIVVDSSGNLIITGQTSGNLSGITNSNSTDAFIAKYDSNGHLLWTKLLGTDERAEGKFVSTDANNNIYMVGNGGNATLHSSFEHCIFAKFNAEGERLWTSKFGSAAGGYPTSVTGVAADSDGNTYISAQDTSPNDTYLAKYDTDGVQQWKQSLDGLYFAAGVSVLSEDRILLTGGIFAESTDGISDVFLATFSAGDGTQLRTQQYGTAGTDGGHSIALGSNHAVFVGGTTTGTVEGNTNYGGQDVLVHMFPSP